MEFISNYMDNSDYRMLLSDMTGKIFGFSFEDWYNTGCYEGEYIPFSFIENGRIIANASANIMKFSISGNEKHYIQIGTVMTDPDYRNRGLASRLIGYIINTYEKWADGFYLYANLNAVGFYEKLGFQRLDQYRWYCDEIPLRKGKKECFLKAGECDAAHYRHVLKTAAVNARFDHINRRSLQLFYTRDMDSVYYSRQLDCFAIMRIQNDILYLDSIVSTETVTLEDVLSRIEGQFSRVVLGFTPTESKHNYYCLPYDGEGEYRFYYLGEELKCVDKEKLFFPVMSNA